MPLRVFLILPESPRKQSNQWEQFHPAKDHHKHEYPFGGQGKSNIRAARSHLPDTRAYIAQSGYRRAYGGVEVSPCEKQNDDSYKENEKIDENEGYILINAAGRDGLPVDFHGQHGIGVDDTLQLQHWVFNENQMTENLDTASRRARATTDEHQQEQDNP